MKTELCKIESDLHISRNVNDKLSDKLLVLEWKCQAYEQYSRRECLKILGILAEVGDKDIEVLEILDTVNTPISMNLVKDCHCIPSKRLPQKSCSKTATGKTRWVLLNKKSSTETWVLEIACCHKNLYTSMRDYVYTTKNYGQNAENCGMSSEFCDFGLVMGL